MWIVKTLTLTTLTFKIVTYSITLEINLGYFKKYNINWHKWIILYIFSWNVIVVEIEKNKTYHFGYL